MKRKLLLSALCFYSASLFAASNIISVKPDFIKMRHSADVKVDVSHNQPDLELSVIPGGTYIEKQTVLPSDDFDIYFENNTPKLSRISTPDKKSDTPYDAVSNTLGLTAHIQGNDISIQTKFQKIGQWKFKSSINKVSLGDSAVCLVLSDKQLIHINFQKNTKAQTTLKSLPLKIGTGKNSCITANQQNIVTLWQDHKGLLSAESEYMLNHRVNQLLAYQNLILIANGRNGLSVLRINKQNQLRWKSSYSKLGNVTRVANDGTNVLVADDEGVLTFIDITGANRPLLISDFYLGESPKALWFKSGLAYALLDKKLVQVNFKSKATPLITTLGVNQGGSRRSFIDGEILYVADWFSGLHLYDISEPYSPRLISSFHTPGSPKGVLVRNGIAYVAADDHGLEVIDVRNPQKPIMISRLPLSGLAYTMKLRGNTLYLASHYGGFHIIDIADASHPKLLGTVDTHGKPWALALKGEELYVADDQDGLLVFDITNPHKPALKTHFNPGGFAEDIIIKNNRAYLAFFDLGLFILDISDSSNIKVISRLKTAGSARGISLKGNLLYLASWEAGVNLIDISDEKQPRVISHYDTDGATWGISVKNHYVYAMDWWGGIKVIDANNKEHLRQIAKYQTAGKIYDISFNDHFLYTARGSRGLQIYEATNGLNPVWCSGIDISGTSKTLTVTQNMAAVGTEDNGIHFIDISNSFEPQWKSKIQLREPVTKIALAGQTAIAQTNSGKLIVIDIRNILQPEVIATYKFNAIRFQLQDDDLWLLDHNHQLRLYHLQTDNSLQEVNQFSVDKMANNLLLDGSNIYVSNTHNLIIKYEFRNNTLTQIDTLKLGHGILDMHKMAVKKLLVTTENRVLNVLRDGRTLQRIAQYPTTDHIDKITTKGNFVFFSGESLIASGKLLPDLAIRRTKQGFSIAIPKDMPLGSYDLALSDAEGHQQIKINGFEIGFPKYKPKITLDYIKKKMREMHLTTQPQSE